MARTNGDLDYDNCLFFSTGYGASGGGSDLDQRDTRRRFKMRDASLFIQDGWRTRPGLTLNLGVRWDFFGNPVDPGRPTTYSVHRCSKTRRKNPGTVGRITAAIGHPRNQ